MSSWISSYHDHRELRRHPAYSRTKPACPERSQHTTGWPHFANPSGIVKVILQSHEQCMMLIAQAAAMCNRLCNLKSCLCVVMPQVVPQTSSHHFLEKNDIMLPCPLGAAFLGFAEDAVFSVCGLAFDARGVSSSEKDSQPCSWIVTVV